MKHVKAGLSDALTQATERSTRRAMARAVRESLEGEGGKRQGPVASEEALAALPTRIVGLRSLAELATDLCTVCQEGLQHGDEVKRLPCGHEFHADCIGRWLTTRKNACPLCAQAV